MHIKKIYVAGATLLLSTVLLTACKSTNSESSNTSGQLAKTQVLNWTESSNLATNDLSHATDTLSFNVLLNTEEGLYRLDSKGTPQKALITKDEVSKDGKTYTFELRKDAKWSNGDSVTAQNFVDSWQRTVDPKTASQDAFYLYIIKNAQQINQGKLPLKDLGIHADGKYKLTVTLEKPVTYFKKLLAWPLFFPINKQVVDKYGKSYGTSYQKNVYDGPFKLTGWTGTNGQWSLVQNEKYWDKKAVHLTKINETVVESTNTGYELFNSKKVDETLLSGIQVKNNLNNPDFVKRQPTGTSRLDLSLTKVKAFKNINIRRAISLAIDRKQLTNDVLQDGSTPSKGFVPNGMGKNPKTGEEFADEAYVKEGASYDLIQAKKLLAKGLKEEHLKSLSFSILGNNTDDAKNVLEFLQTSLNKLPNVHVTLTTLPFVQLIAKQDSKDYQATVKGWQSVFADPINFLDVYESISSYNTSGWDNKQFDSYIDASENKDANNSNKRWQDLVNAEKTLITDQGTIPLYQTAKPQLLRNNVKGVVYNPSGVPYDWKTTYITK